MVLKKISVFGLLFLSIWLWQFNPLFAGDRGFIIGPAIAVHNDTLLGLSGGVSYKTEPSRGSFSEIQMLAHYLYGPLSQILTGGGEGQISRNLPLFDDDDDGGGSRNSNQSYSITVESYEINWFYLMGQRRGSYFGPGIGYGVATVKEETKTNGTIGYTDPSKFFSGDDIHYGSLLLKYGRAWDNQVCEFQLSSLGGMIGGGVLCGILF